MLDRSAVGQLSSLSSRKKWQRTERLQAGDTLRSVSPACNRCHFVMKVVQQLTCLTLGRANGPAYSTGELLNTPLM